MCFVPVHTTRGNPRRYESCGFYGRGKRRSPGSPAHRRGRAGGLEPTRQQQYDQDQQDDATDSIPEMHCSLLPGEPSPARRPLQAPSATLLLGHVDVVPNPFILALAQDVLAQQSAHVSVGTVCDDARRVFGAQTGQARERSLRRAIEVGPSVPGPLVSRARDVMKTVIRALLCALWEQPGANASPAKAIAANPLMVFIIDRLSCRA
jgi:hypothetical protein